MSDFTNSEKRSEILAKIEDAKSKEDIEALIEEYYPDWLVYSLSGYSTDYPHLQSNWLKICEMSKVTPKKIVLVANIIFDNEHTIINKVAEKMTHVGYCIRRVSEFIACPKCEKAIPCKDIWFLLKDKGFKVPKEWKNKCENC